jgi:predicted transcriptional regulator
MMKKLPDAEFDIMQLVWANEPPITTSEIMRMLGNEREWKIQTVVSLMLRLSEKGFLRSEKHSKERTYFPTITREEYLKFETGSFLGRFHNNSFLNLVTTVYNDESLSDDDIEGLLKFINELKARKQKGR